MNGNHRAFHRASSFRHAGFLRRAFTVAGVMIISVALSAAPLRAQESGIPVGTKAPTATIETLDGKPADLAQYFGKGPVVIEFWATWCPNCKELEPALLAAQKKYAKTVQFVGVAVSVNESPELVRRYVEKHGVAGVHLYDRKGLCRGCV